MDEDWPDFGGSSNNGNGVSNGSSFAKGRGYSIADKDDLKSRNDFDDFGSSNSGDNYGRRARGNRRDNRFEQDGGDRDPFGGNNNDDPWSSTDKSNGGFGDQNDDDWGDGGSKPRRGGGGGRPRGDRRGGGRGGGSDRRGGRSFRDSDKYQDGDNGGFDDGFSNGDGFDSGPPRRGGRGGRGGGQGDDANGNGEENKPQRSTYIPEETNDDELFANGISTGINFEKYKDIPVKTSGENVPPAVKSFEDAGFRDLVKENIALSGYKKLTPIQSYSIPIILAGRDLMGCAQTGSGKTAAFLLPIINNLLEQKQDLVVEQNLVSPQCLIVLPTRELTTQIYEQARKFARRSSIKVCQIYGGTQVFYQRSKLVEGCHILVATPGRLNGFVRQGLISFVATRFVVLDEADRMLDMGFEEDIKCVMNHDTMSQQRQTLMFSATFPDEVQECAARYLNDYVFVSVGIVGAACSDIEQKFIEANSYSKREVLVDLLNKVGTEGTLVFVETKRRADYLAVGLNERNFLTTTIHGDRLQKEREIALREFKSGRRHILVATDVAARGLDIKNVRHVVNFDMPKEIDQYVHRIGRTGRVGNKGIATSFFDVSVDMQIAGNLARILRAAGQPVPEFLNAGAGGSYGNDCGFGGEDVRGNLGQLTMWYVIVTCRTLIWTLTSLLSSMAMLSALLSPAWLLGQTGNSVGVYTRCMESKRTPGILQCTTLATRGLATDPEVFPNEWKFATVFIAIGVTVMFISVVLSFAACCFQSIFRKSLFTSTGAAQTVAGIFYILALTLHPLAWSSTRVRKFCGDSSPFYPGDCAVGVGLWLALAGTGLTFLAACLSMPADKSTNSDKVQDRIYEEIFGNEHRADQVPFPSKLLIAGGLTIRHQKEIIAKKQPFNIGERIMVH